jgi:hypothetical protein
MSSFIISPSQILNHREARKNSGLVGCITGRPEPEMDFFSFRDVQIWNRDASGRLNGDEGFNPRDPWCFCFDCRDAFDPNGTTDAELINEGHTRATEVYQNIINEAVAERQRQLESDMATAAPPSVPLAHTVNSSGWFYARPGCPCVTCVEWSNEPETHAEGESEADAMDTSESPIPRSLPPLRKTPSGRFVRELPIEDLDEMLNLLRSFSSYLHKEIELARAAMLILRNGEIPMPPPEFDIFACDMSRVDNLLHKIKRMTADQ